MNLYNELEKRAGKSLKTIIYPESDDPRVIKAVRFILRKRSAKVILIQKESSPEIRIKPDKNLIIIDQGFSSQFLNEYHLIKIKKKPDFKRSDSETEIMDPLIFSCMLLKNKYADGIIAGSVYSTSEVLRNAISIIGTAQGNKTVSSLFLFNFQSGSRFRERILAFADCGVIPSPDAVQLSDIATQTSANFKLLTGRKPKVAFLSFSTKGSAKDPSLEKILEAYYITKKRNPDLICEAELQFDAAFVPEVAERKNPDGIIKGDANVFIFPDLNSGNIAYKITERIGGANATGPVLQGLAKPVMDLSRGCSEKDIINMTAVLKNLIK
ncbi:MAG: phosphotransacetylase [Bacteroidetes bacterium]|nr:phosphotransacetylase [Bacteroidota bacterium]